MHSIQYKKWIKLIDEKAKETIHPDLYADIVFHYTKDKLSAKNAKRNVLLAAKYILWLDLYYETKKDAYNEFSKQAKKDLLNILTTEQKKQFKKVYEQIKGFWQYEASLAKRKPSLTRKERLEYLSKKSSDVFLYSVVAEQSNVFTEKVVRSLYQLQQLNDIFDDLIDTKEDRQTNSPNLVFLFSWRYKSPKELMFSEKAEIKSVASDLMNSIERNTPDLPRVIKLAKKYLRQILKALK